MISTKLLKSFATSIVQGGIQVVYTMLPLGVRSRGCMLEDAVPGIFFPLPVAWRSKGWDQGKAGACGEAERRPGCNIGIYTYIGSGEMIPQPSEEIGVPLKASI